MVQARRVRSTSRTDISERGRTPLDGVCFHAHAAIEKLLKAGIVKRGTFPPRKHELLELLEMQPDGLRQDSELRQACNAFAGPVSEVALPRVAHAVA